MPRCAIFTLVLLCLTFLSQDTVAQKAIRKSAQYKRIHQQVLKMILSGDPDKAIKQLEAVLAKFEDDAESHFMLTLAHAKAGRVDDAVAAMKRAVKLGLPAGRFIAGPRELMAPLHQTPAFKSLLESNVNQPVHGPLIGQVTDTTASFWVRTNGESLVSVLAEPEGKSPMIRSDVVRVSKANDYTEVITIKGLKPGTRYLYDVYVDDHGFLDRDFKPLPGQAFTTTQAQGKAGRFTIAFGGGAGYVPQHEHMWNTIAKTKPDALLLLGDNVYIDDPQSPAMQKYCYYRRQSRPEFRALVAKTPTYTIWDDHDFATNDSWGGPAIDEPAWKRPVWKIFTQNWANPSYGGGEKQPGCWYDFHIGDVHFIMLDGRYYRTAPKSETLSILGPVQRKWLLATLKQSKSTLKVLCSPVPWTFRAKGDSKDTWNGYKDERNLIFDFLAKQKIEGVLLMSADRHRSDLWEIDRPGGYPLYEFNSSRLTNQHIHAEMKQAEFSYNKKQSFGLVTFDTTKRDVVVNYKIVTIDGETVFDFDLKKSLLKH